MIKQSEWTLMHLLKCGQADLSILDDIGYELDDILDELMADNRLSLTDIIREVFKKGIQELSDLINDTRADIITELQILNDTVPKESDSAEVMDKKEAALDENDIYLCDKYDIEWGDEIPELIEELSEIKPAWDVEYSINFLDTHIWFTEHKEIYRRFFADQISEIEERMGFFFSNY